MGFLVNDLSQGQVNVPANVTVEVKSVRSYDVTQATLLTLEVAPRQVITPETQVGDWELKYKYTISISIVCLPGSIE